MGLLVAGPLAALAVGGARARRVRAALRLPDPRRRSLAPALLLVALAALLALAAAQPVVADARTRTVRADVEALVVVDISRSMLAAEPPGETRFARARAAAVRLRRSIADVPVGVASLTDRMLPHLFPTPDQQAFTATLFRSLAVERPPPSGFWARATSYAPLAELVDANFFSRRASRRVAVVLTDGEARPLRTTRLRRALARPPRVRVLFVRFWSPGERVFRPDGRAEAQYRPDPSSGQALERLAAAVGGRVVDGRDLAGTVAAIERLVGDGRRARRTERGEARALAPYAVAAAFVPLLLLLRLRNRA